MKKFKQKSITIILTIMVICAPLLIIPDADNAKYNILRYVVLLIGATFLLIWLILDWRDLNIDKKDILILIFLALVFISTFISSDIDKSILGEKNRYEGTLMFTTYICIYLCSKKYFNYSKINIFLNIMFYVSSVIGILGIAQNYIKCNSLYPIFNKGICSTFGNSNFFGSYISIVLPLASMAFILKGSKKGCILSNLMFFNMLSAGTRSAWVALVTVSILFLIYLLKQRNKKEIIRTIILILCFTLIFGFLYNGFGLNKSSITTRKVKRIIKEVKIATKSGISEKMGSGRIEIWKMTLKLISIKPIFGCGPDNLKQSLLENCTEEFYTFAQRTKTVPDKAHNEYLHIAATLGVPALIIYLIFGGMILFPKMKKMLSNKTYLIISLCIISYLTQAFFNISTIGVAPIFWMILGLSDNKNIINKLEEIL